MRPRSLLRRYAFAWAYLGCYVAAQTGYALLSPRDQARFLGWASTSVTNLRSHPLGCLLVSAVVTDRDAWAWPVLIAPACFAAVRLAGNRRTLLVCAAGHVVGTLVSEGIVAHRVNTGALPESARHLVDVGPSYVVVAALVLALLHGWRTGAVLPARAVAALDLAILVYAGNIFGGLSGLEVSAVGHLAAMVTAGLTVAVSGGVAHTKADEVGDAGGADAQDELADATAPERPVG